VYDFDVEAGQPTRRSRGLNQGLLPVFKIGHYFASLKDTCARFVAIMASNKGDAKSR
jgi:hypothetical protein